MPPTTPPTIGPIGDGEVPPPPASEDDDGTGNVEPADSSDRAIGRSDVVGLAVATAPLPLSITVGEGYRWDCGQYKDDSEKGE